MPSSPSNVELPILQTILLWSARALTCLILCFWLFFIAAHLLGDSGAPSRTLTPRDYISLSALIASLLGLALALKWNRLGAAFTLAAVAIGALMNWKVLLFPPVLIPVTAGLFLISSFQSRSLRQST